MTNVKNLLALLFVLISTPVLAFMPAAGMWGVDTEDNGLPGRGFQIEAENGIIVFTYFGYRADGSGTFHYASGPIVNNTFTSPLLNIQGGTTLGGAHQNASVAGSAGTVTINFTSGKHGIITLPGEPQRAISKRPFGYADGPDGLLGTWLFTMAIGQTPFSEIRNLSVKTGTSTPTGNGFVTTATGNFICELQISGALSGLVACFNVPQVSGAQSYLLKLSGDKGDGVATFRLPSGDLSAFQSGSATRTATKNNVKTGLSDNTQESLAQHSQIMTEQSAMPDMAHEKSISPEDIARAEALKAWTIEAQAVMKGT